MNLFGRLRSVPADLRPAWQPTHSVSLQHALRTIQIHLLWSENHPNLVSALRVQAQSVSSTWLELLFELHTICSRGTTRLVPMGGYAQLDH